MDGEIKGAGIDGQLLPAPEALVTTFGGDKRLSRFSTLHLGRTGRVR